MLAFPDAKRVRPKTRFAGGLHARWKDAARQIYEWDYKKGAVERYDASGTRHVGDFDAVTGKARRTSEPATQRGTMSIKRRVTKFRKRGSDELVGEYDLRGVRASQLKRIFDAQDDDAVTLCYPIGEGQREFVEAHLGERLDLRRYDYFIGAYDDAGATRAAAARTVAQVHRPSPLRRETPSRRTAQRQRG